MSVESTAANLGTASGYLILDTTGFESGLNSASRDLNSFRGNFQSSMSSIRGASSGLTSAGQDISSSFVRPIVSSGEEITRTASSFRTGASNIISSVNSASNNIGSLNSRINETGSRMDSTSSASNRMNGTFGNSSRGAQNLTRQLQMLEMQLGGEVPQATREAYTRMFELNQEVRSAQRAYGSYSPEVMNARNALSQFALSLDDTTFKQVYMRNQLGLSDVQLQQQANSLKLNARMTSLMGNQTQILTQRMEGLQRFGVKPKDMLPPSTIGQFQLLNETMAASGVHTNMLSAGFRRFGTAMESNIKGWSAQKLAVKAAGDDMVKYGILLRGMTAAQMNMGLAFPIVGLAAAAFYATLFSAAVKSDEKLQALVETVKGKLAAAFQPLMKTTSQFLTLVLTLVGKVADWITKFNELHPVMAKVLSVIALLAPAMTLLLLPLGSGVGLIMGWKLAINGLWVIMGPLVTMIGTASSTFMTFALIIGTVVAALVSFYKSNESFRNTVNGVWESVRTKAKDVFGSLATYFSTTLPAAFKSGGIQGVFTSLGESILKVAQNLKESLPKLFESLVKGITEYLPQIISKTNEIRLNILDTVLKVLPEMLATGAKIISQLVKGIMDFMPTLIDSVKKIITDIADVLIKNLPPILDVGGKIISQLIKGIADFIPELIDTSAKIITDIVDTIVKNLPEILAIGEKIINQLAQGISDNLPVMINKFDEIRTKIVDVIMKVLPSMLSVGEKIISQLVKGVSDNIPIFVNTALKVVTGFVDVVTKNLPQLLKVIADVINKLVKTWTDNLPLMYGVATKVVTGFVNGIVDMLPSVIDAAIQIIQSLLDSLIENLPILLDAAIKIIDSLIDGIIQSLPKLVESAVKIVGALIEGIIKLTPQFYGAALKLLGAIIKAIIEITPKCYEAALQIFGIIGKTLLEGFMVLFKAIGDYILSIFNSVWESVKLWVVNMVTSAVEMGTKFLQAIIDFFTQLPTSVLNFINQAFNSVVKWVNDMVLSAQQMGKNFLDAIVLFFTQLPERIGYFIGLAIGNVVRWATNMIDSAKKTGSEFLASIASFFNELPGKIQQFLTSAHNNAVTWSGNMITKAKETGTNFLSSIVSFFNQLPGKVQEFFSSAYNNATTWAGNMATKATEAGTNFLNNVVAYVNQIPAKVQEYLTSIITSVTNWATDLGTKGTEAAQTLYNNFTTGIAELPGKMLETGKFIVEGLWNGIDGSIDWLKKKISGFADAVLEGVNDGMGVESPSRFTKITGGFLAEGIGVGFAKKMPSVLESIKTLASEATNLDVSNGLDNFKTMWTELSDWFVVVGDKVSSTVESIGDSIQNMAEKYSDVQMGVNGTVALGYVGYNGITTSDKSSSNDQGAIDNGLSNKGDVFVFNSPKAINELEAAKQMKKAKRDLVDGF